MYRAYPEDSPRRPHVVLAVVSRDANGYRGVRSTKNNMKRWGHHFWAVAVLLCLLVLSEHVES